MGFLAWFKKNPQTDDSTGSQLDLLGASQELTNRKRVDGITVRKKFTGAIVEKGGDDDAIANSTEQMTREVLGTSTKNLYKETGAKRHKRDTLPSVAQEALMTGEIVATHDLQHSEEFDGTQEQVNQQIESKVRKSSKKVRKLFPW